MKTKPLNHLLNALFYFVAFIVLQFVFQFATAIGWYLATGLDLHSAIEHVRQSDYLGHPLAMAVINAIPTLVIILVFGLCRWSPFSRVYIRKRPWALLFWVVVLALGTIIPSEWMIETLHIDMPADMKKVLETVMSHPAGYIVLGILVPVAEEMVFRGAILRSLLNTFDRQWHWLPIILSALVFGVAHGNSAQFIHATLMGLLIGWMYYRTNSIVPGIVFHWVNNTVAYVAFHLFPQTADGNLIDLFGHNERTVLMAVGCSLLIFLPSLFQVAMRIDRK